MLLIWQLIVLMINIYALQSAPLCAYINFETGFGSPLNRCHPVYNDGLLRSFEYICDLDNYDGYFEILHGNHQCIDGPFSVSVNITDSILYGDCHDSECTQNILQWISFINDNCTENWSDTYFTNIALINECMEATVIISTPPTRAATVYCNEEFFQIGYFGDTECNNALTFPQRFYFNDCNDQGFPNEYYKLDICTDPINADILNKYPYKNGSKSDYDKFVKLFVNKIVL